MYVSPVDPHISYFDDDALDRFAKPFTVTEDGQQQSASGYIKRDYDKQPLGSIAGTTSFPQELLLDEKQARERIEELERTKTDIVSLLQASWQAGVWKGLNQDPTNYCWCYAVTHAVMIARLLAGEPFKRLSPYSVACIVKNFSNIGGWGGEANEQMVNEGVATEEFWPMEKPGMSSSQRQSANMNAIRNGRQYLQSSRANAGLKKVYEFWELKPRNNQEKLSCLCIPIPVASGYNRIGHERCSVKATVLSNGAFGCIDLDSYTSDGSPDLKSFAMNSMPADDAVVPRVVGSSDV